MLRSDEAVAEFLFEVAPVYVFTPRSSSCPALPAIAAAAALVALFRDARGSFNEVGPLRHDPRSLLPDPRSLRCGAGGLLPEARRVLYSARRISASAPAVP